MQKLAELREQLATVNGQIAELTDGKMRASALLAARFVKSSLSRQLVRAWNTWRQASHKASVEAAVQVLFPMYTVPFFARAVCHC